MGVCSSTKNLKTDFSAEEIAKAMKESLNLAAKFAEDKTAGEGKFTDNEAIRIELPEELLAIKTKLDSNKEKIDQMMMSKMVDEEMMSKFDISERLPSLQLQMNKSAEKACVGLSSVFINVIKEMSAENVVELIQGEGSAITAFLRKECEPQLTEKMTPIIEKEMGASGLTDSWKDFQEKYTEIKEKLSGGDNALMSAAMSVAKAVTGVSAMPELDFDMNGYMMEKIMNAIFGFLSENEAEMKKSPMRVPNDLVAGVFKKYCQAPEKQPEKEDDASPADVDLAEKEPLVKKDAADEAPAAVEGEGENAAEEAVKVEE